MSKPKIGLIQPEVTDNNDQNCKNIEKLIEEAVQQEPDILCLPERWFFVNIFAKDFSKNIQEPKTEQYGYVKQWAKEYNTRIISGAIWEYQPQTNTPVINAYYFDPQGRELFVQQKIHPYSFETKYFEAGDTLICFTDVQLDLCFSILICFDIAFFETPRLAALNGAQLLFSPTLIRKIGMENWEIYLKARALENRIPVAACNSCFKFLDREFLGSSKIIQYYPIDRSPTKLKVKEAGISPEALIDEVDVGFADKIRGKRLQEARELESIQVKSIKK